MVSKFSPESDLFRDGQSPHLVQLSDAGGALIGAQPCKCLPNFNRLADVPSSS